ALARAFSRFELVALFIIVERLFRFLRFARHGRRRGVFARRLAIPLIRAAVAFTLQRVIVRLVLRHTSPHSWDIQELCHRANAENSARTGPSFAPCGVSASPWC